MKFGYRFQYYTTLTVACLALGLASTRPEGKPDVGFGLFSTEGVVSLGVATVYFSQGMGGSFESHIGIAGRWFRIPDEVLVGLSGVAGRVQKAKDVTIQTFAVVPLSTKSGLLEWARAADVSLPTCAILSAYVLGLGFAKAFPAMARRHLAVSRTNLRNLRVYTVHTACVCHADLLHTLYSAALLLSAPELDRPVYEVYFTVGGVAACLTTFMTRSSAYSTDTGSGSFSSVPLYGAGGALAGVFAYAAFMDPKQRVVLPGVGDADIGVVLTVHLVCEVVLIARGLAVISHVVGAVSGVALAIASERLLFSAISKWLASAISELSSQYNQALLYFRK
jgi:membrane associated rhomboid family serine protease